MTRYYAPDGTFVDHEHTYTKAEHEAALTEAVAKEREACAMVCNQNNGDMAWQLEAKIRARAVIAVGRG